MRQNAQFSYHFRESPIAKSDDLTLSTPNVTVGEAFRLSLDALIKARFGGRAVGLTAVSGISSSTISRMLSGERFAGAGVMEQLRVAFDIPASGLFDPDAALRNIGLARVRTTDTSGTEAHTYAGHQVDDPLPYGFSPDSEVDVHHYPDAELLAPLLKYWIEMTPEARLEIVGHGRRLRENTKVVPHSQRRA
jgi:hypothetical protein